LVGKGRLVVIRMMSAKLDVIAIGCRQDWLRLKNWLAMIGCVLNIVSIISKYFLNIVSSGFVLQYNQLDWQDRQLCVIE